MDSFLPRSAIAARAMRVAFALASLLVAVPTLAQAPAPPGPPPAFLVGVIIPEAGEPMAIMEDPQTREQTLHTLGAQIGGVRLTKILRDRVVLSAGDTAIEVRLVSPAPPRPTPRAPARFRPPIPRARPVAPR